MSNRQKLKQVNGGKHARPRTQWNPKIRGWITPAAPMTRDNTAQDTAPSQPGEGKPARHRGRGRGDTSGASRRTSR